MFSRLNSTAKLRDIAGKIVRLGNVPLYNWAKRTHAIESSNNSAIWFWTSGVMYFLNNAYYDGASWRYKKDGVAGLMSINTSGTIGFNTAVTGIAGEVITWVVTGSLSNAGAFNAVGAITGSNLSGTNTGDQTALTVPNTPAGNIAATTVQGALDELDTEKQAVSSKDATGGYAGLTLFKINFKNAANTFTSFFTNSNTAARTYTFQDRDGTIADNTDLALKANLASPTFTGVPAAPTAAAGTNTTQIATTAFVIAASGDVGIGVGQTWQTVTRTAGVTYTNSTGKSIMLLMPHSATQSFTLTIGSYTFPAAGTYGNDVDTISYIIPNGSTYSYTGTKGSAHELR